MKHHLGPEGDQIGLYGFGLAQLQADDLHPVLEILEAGEIA